jgi:hypothetical protein
LQVAASFNFVFTDAKSENVISDCRIGCGMPSAVSPFGNLYAYKLYTLPTAKRLFGSYSFRRKTTIKHHTNVQKMLEILALNGPLTTWGMAKIIFQNDVSSVRTKEKVSQTTQGTKRQGKAVARSVGCWIGSRRW